MAAEPRLRSRFVEVSGWEDNGLIERGSLLPRGVRGRLRSLGQARSLAKPGSADVIWTSAWDVAPYFAGLPRRSYPPLILDTDASFSQLNEMAPHYRGRPPLNGLALATRLWLERRLLARVTFATPWSHWAAEGLRNAGLPADRIHVIPPGVDLERWTPSRDRLQQAERPLRLLFVGGDFARKGGDTLLSLVGGPLAGRVTLDVVTHDAVEPAEGVQVHRATPNSPELHRLYSCADLFVLPTRAECFGIAAVEAMASGIPVLMSDVGGARDIVAHNETGWLTRPEAPDVLAALEHALSVRDQLPVMGEAARARAETRFDGRANHERLVDLILDLTARGELRGSGNVAR